MHYVVVEILPIDPFETEVTIVPLYEQLIEEIQPDSENAPCTLAQALWQYAAKVDRPLLSILDEDENACKFVMQFEESWFVRGEVGPGNRIGNLRDTSKAVEMAKILHARRMARQVLDECNSK